MKLYVRILLVSLMGINFVFGGFDPASADEMRPNIVWISCEDISPHLGCYGYPQATTPHLDAFATQGVRFENASTVTGVCATCRASMITAMYPSTLGNQFMRCKIDLPDHIRLFPDYFKDAGYYCTNNSKTDYNVTGKHSRCWDESSKTAHFRNRKSDDQPFFAVFNFTNTHESKVFNYKRPKNLSDGELHDPNKMELPPYYPDTPVTRRDWAHYYDNITSMDKLAGNVLRELDEDGLADNTIVVYWSDHGAGLPRAKRWIYESGTHVPLIIRIPTQYRLAGQAEPGSVSSELVSLMDLGPTMMNLAGLSVPDSLHGRAFLGANRDQPRKFIFTIRDRMDERYDMIRAVRDKRYKYIRNYQAFKPYFQIINFMEQEHTMQELRRLHAAGELHPAAEQFMASRKPPEELYDLENDPHEINNLIDRAQDDLALQHALETLREAHQRWVFETLDTGLIPEADLTRRAIQAGSRYQILHENEATSRRLLARLMEVNRLACHPVELEPMTTAFSDEDPAVRYWAVTGIGNLKQQSPDAMNVISRALNDPIPCVRVAAARAAWQLGRADLAIPILKEIAPSDKEFLSLLAIQVIDEMDDHSDDFRDVVTWIKENGKPYPARVATYLIKQQSRP